MHGTTAQMTNDTRTAETERHNTLSITMLQYTLSSTNVKQQQQHGRAYDILFWNESQWQIQQTIDAHTS
jgi:hypothetical protein